jgi:hypothetical protein
VKNGSNDLNNLGFIMIKYCWLLATKIVLVFFASFFLGLISLHATSSLKVDHVQLSKALSRQLKEGKNI